MGEPRDGPDCYVVLHKAVVTRERKFLGDEGVVAKVDVGGFVEVLEVEECEEDMRVRARIEKPAGWMSLLNTETGRRWAQRALRCPQGHQLLRETAATVGGRCGACGDDIPQGDQLLRCQPCRHRLCSHCVAGCAQQKAWTFDAEAGVDVEVLGFTHEVLPPCRVLIRDVQMDSWADDRGVKVGDEIVAANGVRVDKMPQEEFANLFRNVRPLKLTILWDAQADITPPVEEVVIPGPQDPMPQLLNGRPVQAPFWGVSRAQCRDLLRQLRKDPSWKAEGTMQELVTEYIAPMTKGSGLGYALWKNKGAPKEVNVVVTHSWGESAERLLETLLRSTSPRDVLFIAALALYQAQDSAGPRIEEQLGSCPSEGPFQKALEHVAAQGKQSRCCCRRRWVQALPPLLLGLAAALLWGPLAYWSCVPSHDLQLCAVRTHPDGSWSQRVEWTWQSEYAQSDAKRVFLLLYIAALGLAMAAAVLQLVVLICSPPDGRLIAVPCQDDKLCGRLWSVYFIYAAKKLKVPAYLANSLASTGTCCASEARCATARDEECLRRLLEDAGPDGQGDKAADSAVRSLLRSRRWALRLAALGWAFLFALLRSADLRLVANEPWRWEPLPPAPGLAVLGAGAGALLCAAGAYGLLWRAGGSLRGWAFCLSPALPLATGAGILAILALTQRLIPAEFGNISIGVNWLSDESYRHADCSSSSCRSLVAFLAPFAQTLLVGGANLGVFVVGTICCPRFIKRHQCIVGSLVALFLVGAACAVFIVGSLVSVDGLPEPEFLHAAVIFHLTQLLARCAVPLGALCTFAACWGWPSSCTPAKAAGKAAVEGCATEQQVCTDGEDVEAPGKPAAPSLGGPSEEESRRMES